MGPFTVDHWSATVPAGGSATLTYAIDGTHSVTFTNPAAGGGTCAITPADPGYSCGIEGTAASPADVLTGPALGTGHHRHPHGPHPRS